MFTLHSFDPDEAYLAPDYIIKNIGSPELAFDLVWRIAASAGESTAFVLTNDSDPDDVSFLDPYIYVHYDIPQEVLTDNRGVQYTKGNPGIPQYNPNIWIKDQNYFEALWDNWLYDLGS